MTKKVLLSPLDPVHDIGLKMIKLGLGKAGIETKLLPPDSPPEEIIKLCLEEDFDTLLLGRTLGYGVAELLSRFIDLADASGMRDKVKIGIGGMAIRPEIAAELGYDAGFGPGTSVEEVVAFVQDIEYEPPSKEIIKEKKDITTNYSYQYNHHKIGLLLQEISQQIINWAENRTSIGVERAQLRDQEWDYEKFLHNEENEAFYKHYRELCDDIPQQYYLKGKIHPKTRELTKQELTSFNSYIDAVKEKIVLKKLQFNPNDPVVWNQYGTGCPFMDIAHIKVSEAWGADGVVHFDPSWGARTEGFLGGNVTHAEDGTVITPHNLSRIRQALERSTLWQVRAHRGLNTAETVVLAGKIGADLTKINICYGSLAAGTDPARLTIDGYHAIKYAAKYNMPFDIVTNEELTGVPAYKAFAGMLIVADLAVRLGARPILQPLFAYSPEVMIGGQMEDNYVDFNVAKIMALREIIHAPIWPGAPIGFLTQSEDRVQSSLSTSLHAMLAKSLNIDAISIASADEAYSGGPISVPSKIDTLRGVQEAFRFLGKAKIEANPRAVQWKEELVVGIEKVLQDVANKNDFVEALYSGLLGSKEDGAFPGRAGQNTVRIKKA
ncbi:cobalamin B12-binding domain-containing protein [Heliorestis convoluta]|uniref:Cobalamin-binding protein n=1 Tax=Heliorestis convoluta TaxID=356322 RepID=A0A5Q2N6X0_9FIRM|nr:cobalamin-dependent protein [Heliorestis convoluta]QGG48020.1 cobalamin-binding protein [Heliorestis convoluta]